MQGDPEIRKLIEDFVERLAEQVQRSVVDAVSASFGGGSLRAARRGPGRPPKAPKRGRPAPKRAKGLKRNPEELVRLTDGLGKMIIAKPGLRVEELGQHLGVHSRELFLPIKKLLKSKSIRKTGVRRATKYLPAK